jgi:hypothetical protein
MCFQESLKIQKLKYVYFYVFFKLFMILILHLRKLFIVYIFVNRAVGLFLIYILSPRL